MEKSPGRQSWYVAHVLHSPCFFLPFSLCVMGTNILEQRMIEDTLDFFQGNDGLEVTHAQGVMLIDGWLQALERDANVDKIRNDLTLLREELNGTTPDPDTIKTLLVQLADEAQDMAQRPFSEGMWTGRLQSMSELLRNFSNQI
jgi:hypothetical protein